MNEWHFYRLDTGELTGNSYAGPAAFLERNTPDGCGVIQGVSDWQYQAVDLATGALVDRVPPQPAGDEWTSWSLVAGRWSPAPTAAALDRDARAERARLLAQSDWVVTRSVERGEPVPAPWVAYRQALRDITNSPEFPASVIWPQAPTE